MPDENIEDILRSLPVRSLAPEAEQEIVAAIHAAGRARRQPWWARRIPIWQAAAACLLAGAVGFWLHRTPQTDRPTHMVPKTVFVRLEEPLFPPMPASSDRLDISRWQAQN